MTALEGKTRHRSALLDASAGVSERRVVAVEGSDGISIRQAAGKARPPEPAAGYALLLDDRRNHAIARPAAHTGKAEVGAAHKLDHSVFILRGGFLGRQLEDLDIRQRMWIGRAFWPRILLRHVCPLACRCA
jgi:hypothetical protein